MSKFLQKLLRLLQTDVCVCTLHRRGADWLKGTAKNQRGGRERQQ